MDFRLLACSSFGMFVISGCIQESRQAPPATPPPSAAVSYWNGQGVTGEPRIEIDLSDQRARFFKNDKLVGESKISTGRKGFETPPGSYRVTQRNKDHVSNLYGDYVDEVGQVVKKDVDVTKDELPDWAEFRGAKMPYFLRFHGGYGMHAGRVPTYRASHGCVRLPRMMAQHFYENAPSGTPVIVQD